MKITAIESIQLKEYPNPIWVQIYTDEGLVGLGETFRGADAVATHIHTVVAPYLLGKDPLQIDRHNVHLLGGYLGFGSTSVEVRAASAIDIALWDLFGQFVEQPIHQLLGGLSRDAIRVYNTCAGYNYNNRTVQQRLVKPNQVCADAEGPYDDQIAFMTRADELAHSLVDEGFTAMKIWPFDPFAAATDGRFISAADLRTGLEPFEKIRHAVGAKIEVMCEMHSLWSLGAAQRIARALEGYDPFWIEDPLNKMDNVAALAEMARSTSIPVCASETLAGRVAFRDMLDANAASIIMLDVGWCGGISEARKIASLAETYQRPVAPHDCTGPVVLAASIHLALNAPNAAFQEVVRAYLAGWYREIVTTLPRVEAGFVYPMTGPGLGLQLQPDLAKRADAVCRRTAAD